MIDLYKYKHGLDTNKTFRDSEMRRIIALRKEVKDTNTINMCNLILTYIYDLNWRGIVSQNQK